MSLILKYESTAIDTLAKEACLPTTVSGSLDRAYHFRMVFGGSIESGRHHDLQLQLGPWKSTWPLAMDHRRHCCFL